MKAMKINVQNIVLVVVMTGFLCVAGIAIASSPGVMPPQSHAFGKTLTEWSEAYWWWAFTGEQLDDVGRVNFLPLPAGTYIGGDGTAASPAKYVGEIGVALEPGTPFVLPFFAWTSEKYLDGHEDPFIPNEMMPSLVTNLSGDGPPVVTLDGRPIVKNFWDYYVPPTLFDSIAFYPEPSNYGSIGVAGFQCVAIVVNPLKPGEHILHLVEKYVVEGVEGIGSFGVIYDNTWVIHVK